jgi:hypothetical protein
MNGFVVSRPFPDSNVGSNLASLAGALWLAQRLERELIVDWRGMRQLRDTSANYFSEFFERPTMLGGTRLHYAPISHLEYDQPSSDTRWLSPAEAADLGARQPTALPRVLVLQPYHGLDRLHPGPEAARFGLLRSMYRHIRPAPVVATMIDAFAAEHLDNATFVVGVNVRTGNGHYFQKGMRYSDRVDVGLFKRPEAFLGLLERACRARARSLPVALRDGLRIFYATDSQEMSDLLARLPNAVTRRGVFPPAGAGDLYAFENSDYNDRAAVVDTLADMFLLSQCDALVWNFSLFNQYARVTTCYFGGNNVHFESLFWRKRIRSVAGNIKHRLAHGGGTNTQMQMRSSISLRRPRERIL